MHTCTRSQTGFTDFARIQNFLRSFNFSRGGGRPNPSRSAHADNSLDFYYIYEGKVFHALITWSPLLFDVFETFEFSNWRSGHYFVDHGWWVSYAISFRFVLIYIELRSLFNLLSFLQNTMKKRLSSQVNCKHIGVYQGYYICIILDKFKNHTCTIFKQGQYNSLSPFNVEWIELNILIDQICLKDGTQVLMT